MMEPKFFVFFFFVDVDDDDGATATWWRGRDVGRDASAQADKTVVEFYVDASTV